MSADVSISRKRWEEIQETLAEARRDVEHWRKVSGFATPEEIITAVNERFKAELPKGLVKELWKLEQKDREKAELRAKAGEKLAATLAQVLSGRAPADRGALILTKDANELLRALEEWREAQ